MSPTAQQWAKGTSFKERSGLPMSFVGLFWTSSKRWSVAGGAAPYEWIVLEIGSHLRNTAGVQISNFLARKRNLSFLAVGDVKSVSWSYHFRLRSNVTYRRLKESLFSKARPIITTGYFGEFFLNNVQEC